MTKQEYDALRYKKKHPEKTQKVIVCATCETSFTSNRNKKYCSRTCKNTGGSRRHHKKHNGTIEYCLQKLCNEHGRSELDWKEVFSLYKGQEGKCSLTNVQMTFDKSNKITALSIDRIVPGGPYIIENIRLVCSIANSMRLNMTDSELLYWCERIIQHANSKCS